MYSLVEGAAIRVEAQRVVLEVKILYKSLEATITEGLEQTAGYADQCGAEGSPPHHLRPPPGSGVG